jgi:hypothetical protein
VPNRSLWLTDQEERLVKQLAEVNAASVNMVMRIALRQLLGLPAPKLELPERVETR